MSHLSKNLELLPPLVEVDESLLHGVRYGRVYHGQVCEEGAEVGDGAVADGPRVLLVLLQHLLQVVVLHTRSVCKSCSTFPGVNKINRGRKKDTLSFTFFEACTFLR